MLQSRSSNKDFLYKINASKKKEHIYPKPCQNSVHKDTCKLIHLHILSQKMQYRLQSFSQGNSRVPKHYYHLTNFIATAMFLRNQNTRTNFQGRVAAPQLPHLQANRTTGEKQGNYSLKIPP